jgi:hypothetical protein
MKGLGALLFLMSLAAGAANKPADFAWGLPLAIDGKDALYEVTLPGRVHQGVTRADFGDVRVFNAAGEPVAFALRPQPSPASVRTTEVLLPIFPLRVPAGVAVEGVDLRIETRTDGAITSVTSRGATAAGPRIAGFIADASRLTRSVQALRFDWPSAGEGRSVRVRIDASDDLARWNTVVAEVALVSMEFGGHKLDARQVDLPAGRPKYYRILWVAQEPGLELASVHAQLAAEAVVPPFAWQAFPMTAVAGKGGEFETDLGGPFPVERIRIDLPEVNSVVRVEVLARSRRTDGWQRMGEGVVYRLRQDGREMTSPPLVVRGGTQRYWLLRVGETGGGIGSAVPQFNVGWIPRQLVFAARGEAPFQLAYGNVAVAPAALAIESLVPGYGTEAELAIKAARGGEPVSLGGAKPPPDPLFDYRKWGLWVVLIVAVIALGVMAWALVRQVDGGKV